MARVGKIQEGSSKVVSIESHAAFRPVRTLPTRKTRSFSVRRFLSGPFGVVLAIMAIAVAAFGWPLMNGYAFSIRRGEDVLFWSGIALIVHFSAMVLITLYRTRGTEADPQLDYGVRLVA